MRTTNVKLTHRTKIWFYCIAWILFLSGIAWLAVHYLNKEDHYDSPYAWLKPWSMRIHGAAAMAALVILGVLIPKHMLPAWKANRNIVVALFMVSLCVLLTLSGYGLYYCGDEIIRSWIGLVHSVLGISIPAVLVWHISSGKTVKK